VSWQLRHPSRGSLRPGLRFGTAALADRLGREGLSGPVTLGQPIDASRRRPTFTTDRHRTARFPAVGADKTVWGADLRATLDRFGLVGN